VAGAGVITHGSEGAKFQVVFEFAFDDIETVGGDAVLGGLAELRPLFLAEIPASAASQKKQRETGEKSGTASTI